MIDEAAVNKIIGVIEDIEAATQEPFNRFFDTSATHEVELNFKYVIRVALHLRLFHKGRAPVKSAILATDSTVVHYARLLALMTQGSSIAVRVFEDRVARGVAWSEVDGEGAITEVDRVAVVEDSADLRAGAPAAERR